METIINACIKSYINVMGEEKWNALGDDRQHDMIMLMVKDALKALEGV